MARLAVLEFLVVLARYVRMGFNGACEERTLSTGSPLRSDLKAI